MTTQRAVVFLLVTGGMVLFSVQNASPWHSLAIFGVRTQPLPLSFWLVGAIAAGAISTLFMVGLFDLYGPEFRSQSFKTSRARAKSSRTRETPQYGKTAQTASSSSKPSEPPIGSGDSAVGNADPQDWDAFQSPEQWDDWGQRPDPSVVVNKRQNASAKGESRRKSRRRKEQYAVDQSFEEIAGGWDEYEESAYEEPAYVPRGGSPVEDALDEISTGWDGYEDRYGEPQDTPVPPPPAKDYEVKQAPKNVYRSGSLYSYSYDKTEASDADSIDEAYPSNGPADGREAIEDEGYPADTDESIDTQAAPGPGRVGPDGVYEADYRVIIPPFRKLDEEDDWEDGEK